MSTTDSPVTLIFSLDTSEAYSANPGLLDDFMALFTKGPALSAYAGEQIEAGPNGKKVLWIISRKGLSRFLASYIPLT